MPRDGIGERIDTAFRSPSEALFFAVRQNRTTLLFLSCINGRLIPVRVFIDHLLQTPPKAVLPDLRKGGVQCQRIKSCKNDSRARSKKVPRSGRF